MCVNKLIVKGIPDGKKGDQTKRNNIYKRY